MNTNITRRNFLAGSAVALAGLGLAGCGSSSDSSSSDSSSSDDSATTTGSVYYLNFKPEVDQAWQDLAKKYTDEKGVEVKVVTAASGTYEEKLKSEMAKDSAPTLFQISGYVGLENWKDYCEDLSDSDLYKELTNTDLVLKDGDKIDAIGFVEEDYGIVYNKSLLSKAGYSADDITDFASLKKVADDIQARKDSLGIKGAFVSSGLDSSSSWRFTNHLANMPLWFEFQDDNETNPSSIKGTYLPNYKDIFDLYITDSTCDKSQLSAKTADDAVNEFVNGEAVFYQNGSWGYKDIKSVGDDNIGLLPLYIGAGDQANQGVCAGTENYWAVNTDASDDDKKATLEFLKWVVTSDEGTTALSDTMGFNCPFKSAKEPSNPIYAEAKEINSSKTPVGWAFSVQPNQQYRDDLASALNQYAAGGSWDGVKTAFVDNWATEKASSAE
ncbi:MAG: extracellular solute-binding protein [Atopobiaceae bacterium]